MHLMLWTFCSGVVLSLMRVIQSLQNDLPEGSAAVQQASSVLHGVIAGAAFTGAIVLLHARRKSVKPMLRHPGHWLVTINSAFMAAYLMVAITLMPLSDGFTSRPWMFLPFSLLYMGAAIAYAFASKSSPGRWKVFLGAAGLLAGASGLLYGAIFFKSPIFFDRFFAAFSTVSTWGPLLLTVWAAVIAVVDFAHGVKRDWMHWLGVSVYMANATTVILWMVASWLSPPGG